MNQTRKRQNIKRLAERDGPRCMICGSMLGLRVTIDHIVSLFLGGSNKLDNLQLAHRKCNLKKGWK